MWYTDDSENPGDYGVGRFMLESTDPVTWMRSPGRKINVSSRDSLDVKFHAATNQFVITTISNAFEASAALSRQYSSDGLAWSAPQTVIGGTVFPGYTHDVGVAGDELGNTVTTSTLVGFGAPPRLRDVYSPFSMDLYGVFIDPP
jgi:hypothetical protein